MTRASIRARFSDDDLAPFLLFVALGVLACLTPAQNDTFWHLRSGQYMWETRGVMVNEPFSHTAFGAPLNNHWWLTQLLFFGTYSLGGAFLLSSVAGAGALLAVIGSWRATRGPWELRLGLLVWLVVVTTSEWAVRPQVVSLVFLVVMARLILADRLAWLPVVCVLWANAHAMVILGVTLSAAVALEALVWSRQRTVRALVTTAGCVMAPMVSPLGWGYWPQVLATVTVSRELQIQEYRAPLAAADLPFWVGLAVFVALLFFNRERLRDRAAGERALVIATVVLGFAALTASRNVPFFAVVAAPALSRLWPASRVVRTRTAKPVGVVPIAIAASAVLVGVLIVAGSWRDGGASRGWEPLSVGAIEAVRRCPDPLFNQMEDGGPLMWFVPERRVFVDSRMEAYPLSLLRQSRDVDLGGDYRPLFRDYRIACAVVTTGSALARRLASDESFEAIHSDAHRTVFARAGES